MFEDRLNRKTRQYGGYSLIELMVAMVLGMIVIGGMYSIFTANQKTVRLQRNSTDVIEKANFALDVIADDIRRAGYTNNGGVGIPFGRQTTLGVAPLFQDNDTQYDTISLTRQFRSSIDATSPNPLLANEEMDCVGTTLDPTALDALDPANLIQHTYFVDAATRELKCISGLSPGVAAQAIVGNVEAFQVLYGIDGIGGACPAPDTVLTPEDDRTAECMVPTQYVRGDDLETAIADAVQEHRDAGNTDANEMDVIKTIRLAILISSEDINVVDSTIGADDIFYLLDSRVADDGSYAAPGVDFSRGRFRRVVMRTIVLRQALRGP